MKNLSIFNQNNCTYIAICFLFFRIHAQLLAQGSQTVLEKNGLSFNCAIYTEHYKKSGVDGSEYPAIKTGSFNCFCTQANYSFNGKIYTKESFGGQLSSAFDNVKVSSVRIRGEFPNTILQGPATVDYCFEPYEEKGNNLRSLKKGSPLDGLVQVKSICSLSGLDDLNQSIRQLENEAKTLKEAEEKKKKEEELKIKLENEAKAQKEAEEELKAKSPSQENKASEDLPSTKKERDENTTQDSKMQTGSEESSSENNSSANSYSSRENNTAQANSLHQQAQRLAQQGDIEGAQALANEANQLDPQSTYRNSSAQIIQQNRAIRDSRLTTEAWSRGIDLTVSTLTSLFKPFEGVALIRSAQTPDQALSNYEQVRDEIEQRRQVADQNFKNFHQQNLQDIQNSKSAAEAKANMVVGFANIAGNMAANAKANADAKKAFQEMRAKMDEFRSELSVMHQNNMKTYLQNAANEPDEELEEYYLEMYDFHQCGIRTIEENFSYENSDWAKARNYCDKPGKPYSSGEIDYKQVVRRKKQLAGRFSSNSDMFMNAARFFANKRVKEDKNDPEGYLIRAELSDDIIGKLGDYLIAAELAPERSDIQALKKKNISIFRSNFFTAVDQNDHDFLNKAIDYKLHALAINNQDETPLVYAIRTNNGPALNLFIDRLIEYQKGENLSNLLYLSTTQNADQCVNLLLKRKANSALAGQPSAFQLAVSLAKEEAGIAFLNNRYNPENELAYFQTSGTREEFQKLLRYMVISGIRSDNPAIIKKAKQSDPEISVKDFDNQHTYLSYCAEQNALLAFNALIEGNNKAHLTTDKNRKSLPEICVNNGSFKVLKRLYELGADLSAITSNKELIFNTNNLEMLKVYQSIGANINAQDDDGNTLLHLEALGKGKFQGLLSSDLKFDLNLKNKSGYQVIHIAAWKSNDQMVQLLINSGADINAQGPYQWTALHFAARENDQALVSLLLSNGADKTLKDQWRRVPKQVAKERGFTETKSKL